MRFLALLFCVCVSVITSAQGADKVTMALNWVPEPEFGGIYAAKAQGVFDKHALDVDIKPGAGGVPTWQRVAKGDVQFAVSSADEVLIARDKQADVVAIFSIYQTCPQGIMVHESRGLTSIEEVFKSGTLALEIGLPYGKFLKDKYSFTGVRQIPYTGGIANFLADKNFAQQCFVFAEPILAKRAGATPKTFLIADTGYNPYTGVIITSGQLLRDKPAVVRAMVASMQEGWRLYLDDPKPANEVMAKLNPQMEPAVFAAGAEAQKALIESDDTKKNGLGTMSVARWKELSDQLVHLKTIKKAPEPQECFIEAENREQSPAPANR